MFARSSPPGAVAGLALGLLVAATCGPRPGPNGGGGGSTTGGGPAGEPAGRAATNAASLDAPPAILGVPLGGTPAEVAAALGLPLPEPPTAGESPPLEPLEADLVVAGVPGRVSVRFHEGRASDFSFDVTGAAATEAAYRALAARAAEDLGPGAATRCESEDGVAFDEYLRTGNGRLSTEWRGGPGVGEVQLDNGSAADGSLRIRAFFAVPALLPPAEDLVRGSQGTSRRAARPARLLAAKQEPAGCAVDLSGAPPASILGLSFGADRAAVEAALGRAFEEDHGELSAPHEIAGVPGRLHARFYDGCLAVLLFVVEGEAATPAGYGALRDWARGTALGPGEGFRCLSEAGVEEQAYVEAGFGQRATHWRGREPLEGSLWLHRAWSGEPRAQIVFEADYRPLRDRAPQIDFAGGTEPASRSSVSAP